MVHPAPTSPQQLQHRTPAEWTMQELVDPAQDFVQYGTEWWGQNIDIPFVPNKIERLPESYFEGLIGTDFALIKLGVMMPVGLLADLPYRFGRDGVQKTSVYLVDGVNATCAQTLGLITTDALRGKKPFELMVEIVSTLGALAFLYEGLRVPGSIRVPSLPKVKMSLPEPMVLTTPAGELSVAGISFPTAGVAEGALEAGAVAAAASRTLLPMASVGNSTAAGAPPAEIATLLSRLTTEQRVLVQEIYAADYDYKIGNMDRIRELFSEPAEGVPPNQWTAEQWVRVILEDYAARPDLWTYGIFEVHRILEYTDGMLKNIDAWKAGAYKYNGVVLGSQRRYYNNIPTTLAKGLGNRKLREVALERTRPDLLARLRDKYPSYREQSKRGLSYPEAMRAILQEIVEVWESSDFRGLYDPTDPTILGE